MLPILWSKCMEAAMKTAEAKRITLINIKIMKISLLYLKLKLYINIFKFENINWKLFITSLKKYYFSLIDHLYLS